MHKGAGMRSNLLKDFTAMKEFVVSKLLSTPSPKENKVPLIFYDSKKELQEK